MYAGQNFGYGNKNMLKWNEAAFSVLCFEVTLNTDQYCQFHVSDAVTTKAITLPFPFFFSSHSF